MAWLSPCTCRSSPWHPTLEAEPGPPVDTRPRFIDSPVEGYIFVRILLAIGLLVVATVTSFDQGASLENFPFEVSAVACLLMGVSAVLVRRHSHQRWFVWLQMVIDTIFATALMLLSKGPDSAYSVIYFMSVVAAARMLSPAGVLIVAGMNAVTYGLVSAAGLFGYLGWVVEGDMFFAYTQALVRIFGLLLVGVLSTGLVSRGALLEQIQRTLSIQRAHIDLLDRLPVAILSVEDGEIRELNSFAERALAFELGGQMSLEGPSGKLDWDTQLEIGGELRWLSCRRRQLEGGEQVYILEDITRLREVEALLERDERLAAVGRLAASLAHEIRNPLASLSGSVQLLEEREANPLHRIVLREVQRLNDLVEEFLQAARPLKLNQAQMNMAELLSDVVEAFRNDPRCRGLREIFLDVSALPLIVADSARLRQVVWNLLVNAVQATEVGGSIWVTAEKSDTGINVGVRDDGMGIAPEQLLRIFDPFYTTRSGGTGLGLANVDRIVRAHGGEVKVESTLHMGTTFLIWLPKNHVEDPGDV